MLQLHAPILADDPGVLLQYERGIFELVSPSGKRLRVHCPQNLPLDFERTEQGDVTRGRGWWRIEKVAEA